MHTPRRVGFQVKLLFASVFAFVPLALGQQNHAAAGIQKINHVVFLIKENRTYDNMFGAFNAKYGTQNLHTLHRASGAGRPSPRPLRTRCRP